MPAEQLHFKLYSRQIGETHVEKFGGHFSKTTLHSFL
jgi:hypothetical protein